MFFSLHSCHVSHSSYTLINTVYLLVSSLCTPTTVSSATAPQPLSSPHTFTSQPPFTNYNHIPGRGCKCFVLTDPLSTTPVPDALLYCVGSGGRQASSPFFSLSFSTMMSSCLSVCMSRLWQELECGKEKRSGWEGGGRGGGGSRRGWGLGGDFLGGRLWGLWCVGMSVSGIRGQQVDLSMERVCVCVCFGGLS